MHKNSEENPNSSTSFVNEHTESTAKQVILMVVISKKGIHERYRHYWRSSLNFFVDF